MKKVRRFQNGHFKDIKLIACVVIIVLRRFIKLDKLGTFGHELISTYKVKQNIY